MNLHARRGVRTPGGRTVARRDRPDRPRTRRRAAVRDDYGDSLAAPPAALSAPPPRLRTCCGPRTPKETAAPSWDAFARRGVGWTGGSTNPALFSDHCLLFTVSCSLSPVHCLLFNVSCSLPQFGDPGIGVCRYGNAFPKKLSFTIAPSVSGNSRWSAPVSPGQRRGTACHHDAERDVHHVVAGTPAVGIALEIAADHPSRFCEPLGVIGMPPIAGWCWCSNLSISDGAPFSGLLRPSTPVRNTLTRSFRGRHGGTDAVQDVEDPRQPSGLVT